jgi:hypothetical protein
MCGCRIPQISEARATVEKLEQQRSNPGGDAKVVTSMVRKGRRRAWSFGGIQNAKKVCDRISSTNENIASSVRCTRNPRCH